MSTNDVAARYNAVDEDARRSRETGQECTEKARRARAGGRSGAEAKRLAGRVLLSGFGGEGAAAAGHPIPVVAASMAPGRWLPVATGFLHFTPAPLPFTHSTSRPSHAKSVKSTSGIPIAVPSRPIHRHHNCPIPIAARTAMSPINTQPPNPPPHQSPVATRTTPSQTPRLGIATCS